jgi:hypothetical protein
LLLLDLHCSKLLREHQPLAAAAAAAAAAVATAAAAAAARQAQSGSPFWTCFNYSRT